MAGERQRVYTIDFKSTGDETSGYLVALETGRSLPFPLKRVFYIFRTPHGVDRGGHANRNSRFVLISLEGSCRVVTDDGRKREQFVLERPDSGLYIDRMVWKEMTDFSPDCVLLALSDTLYDATEDIRDYGEVRA